MLRGMPMIDITYPADAISAEQRDALAEALTTALLHAERAPDTEFFRSITWAIVHELPAAHVYAANRPVEAAIVRVQATTPEGALSDRRRAEFVETATKAVSEAFGIPAEQTLTRVWVTHREIAEGSWGAGGQIVKFAQLREAAAAARAEAQGAAV
jgi:phenylpyruvate tautomerase PptA (4-oxalocrotonate tautomerase family)